MLRFLRSVLSILAAFVVASVVMMLVELINGQFLFPELAESAKGVTDREQIREIFSKAPSTALIVVIVGWSLGSLAGGWVAAKLAATAKLQHALILGVLLTLAGVANNLMLPPPTWFWVVSLLVFLPSTFFGARFASSRPNHPIK